MVSPLELRPLLYDARHFTRSDGLDVTRQELDWRLDSPGDQHTKLLKRSEQLVEGGNGVFWRYARRI